MTVLEWWTQCNQCYSPERERERGGGRGWRGGGGIRLQKGPECGGLESSDGPNGCALLVQIARLSFRALVRDFVFRSYAYNVI